MLCPCCLKNEKKIKSKRCIFCSNIFSALSSTKSEFRYLSQEEQNKQVRKILNESPIIHESGVLND